MSEKSKAIKGLNESFDEVQKKECKNYLLSIGIDKYKHCPSLNNAVKDAKDIVKLLINKFYFEKEYITELYDEKATGKNIIRAFLEIAEKISVDDNLIIYFSGHGQYKDAFKTGYWIPVEAEIDDFNQFIPNGEIKDILGAINSHHIFLMIDSCFSGTLFGGVNRDVTKRHEKDPSRWALTSGRNEIVCDGKAGENSPFAKSILYQLEHINRPIGVSELCNKVLEIVAANADQTPRGETLKVAGHLGGQFVFYPRVTVNKKQKKAPLLANRITASLPVPVNDSMVQLFKKLLFKSVFGKLLIVVFILTSLWGWFAYSMKQFGNQRDSSIQMKTELNLGIVKKGETIHKLVKFKNIGERVLVINNHNTYNENIRVEDIGKKVAPGESGTFSVYYTAKKEIGNHIERVDIITNAKYGGVGYQKLYLHVRIIRY